MELRCVPAEKRILAPPRGANAFSPPLEGVDRSSTSHRFGEKAWLCHEALGIRQKTGEWARCLLKRFGLARAESPGAKNLDADEDTGK